MIRVDSLRSVDKGSLRGFATVVINEKLKIHSLRIIQQPGQNAWVSLPQTEVPSKDGGKSKYFPVIEILDEKLKNEITDAVLSACRAEGAVR